ncbi:MAG: transcription termination/antitermination NusG family protein, partial [Candidatus Acidiferrales bacterium]
MAVAYPNSDQTSLAFAGLTAPALPEADESKVNTGQETLPWFALHVRTRREHIVCSHLQAKRFEYFIPLYKSNRAWSYRVKELALRLFPGYVFCRMDPKDRLPVLIIPGVFEIVGNSTSPLVVDESEIAAIQSVVKSGLTYEPWPFLPVGTRVR